MKNMLVIAFAFLFVAGGMPGFHGLTGMEWGKAVSALAKSAPGAVASHIK